MDDATLELLSRHLDHELDADEERELQLMLEADPSLAATLDVMRRVRGSVAALAAREAAPPELDSLIDPLLRNPPQPVVVRPWLRWVGAAAAVVLGVTVIIEVNRGAPGAKVTSIARQAASAHPEPTGRFALAPLPTSSLPPDEQPLGASDKLLASPIIEPEVETPRPLEVLGPLEEDSAVARGDAPAPAAAHIQGTDQVVTPVPEGRLTAGAKSAAEPQAGGRAEAEKGAVDDGGSGQPSEMRSWEAERPKGRAQVFVFIDGRSAWREFAPSSSCRPGRYMVRIVVGGGVIREARPVGGAASAVPSQRLCAAELIRGLEIENVADGEYPAEVVVERRGVGVEGPG